MLFPAVAQGFEELVGYIEGLVDLYNCDLAEGLDRLATVLPKDDSQKSHELFYVNLSTLDKLTAKPSKHQGAYLADMARVEALDAMGENRQAVRDNDDQAREPISS